MKKLLFIFCLFVASFSFASAEEEEIKTRPNSLPVNRVVLQGLNKITARVYNIEAKIGDTVTFGNLSIEVKNCWKSPPEETPENAVLMDIKERTLKNGRIKRLFIGWMFSSSPAISSLEHPVYNVIPIDCYSSKDK